MWLIVSLFAALIVTILYIFLKDARNKYKLSLLALMLWGTTLMILVDHTIASIGGERFMEFTTDGLIKNSTLLGIVMLFPIFLVWAAAVFASRKRRD